MDKQPIHILTADPTAGVLAAQLARLGYECTWGATAPRHAVCIVTPHAPEGQAQADALTAEDVLRGVRNAIADGKPYACHAFTVGIRTRDTVLDTTEG